MRKLLIFYIFIIFITINCKNITSENNSVALSHNWTNISIDTKQNGLSLFDVPKLTVKNGCEYYVDYNEVQHSLNFYNLETKEFERKVEFYNSGPNKIQMISVYNIKDDTIVCHSLNIIKLFNFSGELVKSLELKDMCPELDNNYTLRKNSLVIDNLRRLDINQNTNCIILPTFNKTDGYKNIYDKPRFCEYNINTEQGKAINIEYPKELYKKRYGDLEYPNIISKGDYVIYNFPFKAAVYIYNKKTKRTLEKKFEANNMPSVVEGDDLKVKITRNFFKGKKYHQIIYDKYRKFFYMVYSGEEIGEYKRKFYLIVFDQELKKVGEIDIPSELSSNFVISKSGLLFRNIHKDSFNNLELHVLNILLNEK